MKLLFIFITSFIVVTTNAQVNSTAQSAAINLKSSAQQMLALFIQKKYPAYVKYIHPKITKMMGGEVKMAEVVKNSINQMERQGVSFEKVSIGEPSKIIASTNELQAIIPQIIKLKSAKGNWSSTTYLVAVSSDNGKTWFFVDSNGKTLAQMKSVFPSLSNQLVIPVKTQR